MRIDCGKPLGIAVMLDCLEKSLKQCLAAFLWMASSLLMLVIVTGGIPEK